MSSHDLDNRHLLASKTFFVEKKLNLWRADQPYVKIFWHSDQSDHIIERFQTVVGFQCAGRSFDVGGKMDKFPNYKKILKEIGILDEVKDIEIKEASLHGEHMASVLDYVTITFNSSRKSLKLFVKKEMEANEAVKKMCRDFEMFKKEAFFYNTVLPKCREIVSRWTGDPNPLPFFMKCYYASDEITILENVAESGYKMISKFERQDLAHCRVILKSLAQYHAATYAYINEIGRDNICTVHPEVQASNVFDIMGKSVESSVQTSIDLIKGLDEEIEHSTKALEILQGYKGKVSQLMKHLVIGNKNDRLDVLNHGDLWNNNVMFRESDTGEIDALLFDMQVLRIGSPCLDLGYFLFTSVKDDVRRTHKDEILRMYYDEFRSRLLTLNEKFEVTFEEFKEDFNVKSELGFLISLGFGIGIQIMAEVDISKAGDVDIVEYYVKALKQWIVKNPEKAKLAAIDLINNVMEFHGN